MSGAIATFLGTINQSNLLIRGWLGCSFWFWKLVWKSIWLLKPVFVWEPFWLSSSKELSVISIAPTLLKGGVSGTTREIPVELEP